MKKRILIPIISGAAAIILALGALGGYTAWHYQQPKFHDLTIELGQPLPPVEDFLTQYGKAENASLLTPEAEIDLSAAGEYQLSFSHGIKTETVCLTVTDTTAPLLTLRNVTVDMGTKLTPEDFVEAVSDLSPVELAFAQALDEPESYGTTMVEIIATDSSGNTSRASCTLTYAWIRSQVTIELGSTLSKSDILVNPEKDGHLISQETLDTLNQSPAGVYPITITGDDGRTAICQVTIADTTAPEIKVQDVTVFEGDEVSLEDLLLEATDLAGPVTTKLTPELSTATAGVYTITVEVTDINGNLTTADCKLTVLKDDEAPVFSGLTELSTDKGQKPNYTSGVSATDNRDGTVEFQYDTSNVDLSKPGTYYVTYTAVDAAGNTATEQRTLKVLADSKAPTFSGLGTITTQKNKKPNYTSGVTASDNCDGKVTFTYDDSKVNLTKAGTYYVTYTAVDTAGNKATSRRKVVVEHDQADTQALVDKIAATLSNDAEEIRDYVRDNIKYSSDWGGYDPVWYGFTNKKGNCYVHALCLQELLEAKGFTTKLIWVTDKSHYWVQVKINGVWKHIDATPGVRHTKYSLMNDAQRLETLQGRTWDRSQWPECE